MKTDIKRTDPLILKVIRLRQFIAITAGFLVEKYKSYTKGIKQKERINRSNKSV